ncbi:Double-stranded RNA-binding protein 1 [Citrus sinensis]|nr:Double-stranded RNA-binding protein 1 [Citrus sinensis]
MVGGTLFVCGRLIERLPEKHLCKNRLQEYTQKAGLPLPTYRSKNEGFPHAPKFWAQVEVNGKTYASTGRFTHVKEAEQGAARTALEHITQIVKNAGIPTIQDPNYCKSILNEYCAKINLKKPEYTTTFGNEKHPVFISSMVFNGETYKGEVAGSKKMAEQLAARAAIQSLLESGSEVIRQIISSKFNIHKPALGFKDLGTDRSNLQIVVKSETLIKLNLLLKLTTHQHPYVPTEASKKKVAAFPSTSEMKSAGPHANSSGENKRKRLIEDSSQQKKRVHKQAQIDKCNDYFEK